MYNHGKHDESTLERNPKELAVAELVFFKKAGLSAAVEGIKINTEKFKDFVPRILFSTWNLTFARNNQWVWLCGFYFQVRIQLSPETVSGLAVWICPVDFIFKLEPNFNQQQQPGRVDLPCGVHFQR